jgi:hypothetical protein
MYVKYFIFRILVIFKTNTKKENRTSHALKQPNSTSMKPMLLTRPSSIELIPRIRVQLEKITGPLLVKKFTTFYAKCRFITAIVIYRQIGPVQAPSHLLKAHFKLINSSKPRSSK